MSLRLGAIWCCNHSPGPQSRPGVVQHARVPFSTCGTGTSTRKSRGRWWGGARGTGGLIICWLCCLAMLSTQICMLMSWGRCTVFGSAVGRANQEGSRRVKTQVLQVRAEPMSARRRWWWQREPALCRCSCFLQPNSTRTNGCFWINYIIVYMQLLVNTACISTAIFTIYTFKTASVKEIEPGNQRFVISEAELFRFPYVCVSCFCFCCCMSR